MPDKKVKTIGPRAPRCCGKPMRLCGHSDNIRHEIFFSFQCEECGDYGVVAP